MHPAGMVTDQQVKQLMRLKKREKTLAQAASKAGMDEKTARKCVFRTKPAGDSRGNRPLIPEQTGHPIRRETGH